MKRIVVFLVLVLLVSLPGAGQASDLQAGSYANIVSTVAFYRDPNAPPYAQQLYPAWGEFRDVELWQNESFSVTHGPNNDDGSVYVSLATGTASAQSLAMPVWLPLWSGAYVDHISVRWQSNYDPSEMYLELRRSRDDGGSDLLWSQTQGGTAFGDTDIGIGTLSTGSQPYYFVLNVVPEPTGLALLLPGACLFAYRIKRRR